MKLECLEIGKQFKNYVSLCESLEIKSAKGGRNIKYQKKELERYFNWNVEGRKITITEIYNTPKEKTDGRIENGNHPNSRGQNPIYKDDIDEILKWVIGNKYQDEFITTVSNLAIESNLVNENYRVMNKSESKFIAELKEQHKTINYTAVNNMIYSVKDLVKRTINSSLDRLVREKLIELKKGYVICEEIEFTNEKTGQKLINTRMADEKEISIIKKLEEEVKEELNIHSNKQLVFDEELKNKYYKELEKSVKRELKYVNTLFQGIKIIRFDADVSTKSNEEIEIHKKNLNQTVIDRLKDKFVNIHKKTRREIRNKRGFGILQLEQYKLNIVEKSYLRDLLKVGIKLLKTHIKTDEIEQEEEIVEVIQENKEQEVHNELPVHNEREKYFAGKVEKDNIEVVPFSSTDDSDVGTVDPPILKVHSELIDWAFKDGKILITNEELLIRREQRERKKKDREFEDRTFKEFNKRKYNLIDDDFNEKGEYILPF